MLQIFHYSVVEMDKDMAMFGTEDKQVESDAQDDGNMEHIPGAAQEDASRFLGNLLFECSV